MFNKKDRIDDHPNLGQIQYYFRPYNYIDTTRIRSYVDDTYPDDACRRHIFVNFDRFSLTRIYVPTTSRHYKSGGNDKIVRGILKVCTDDMSSG